MPIKEELLNISLRTPIPFNHFYLGTQFRPVIYSNYSTLPTRKNKVLLKSRITLDSILSNIRKFQNFFTSVKRNKAEFFLHSFIRQIFMIECL